jgi:hypothetical protein
MNVLKTAIGVAIGAWGMGMSGCDVFVTGHEHREARYEQPQPVYVQQQPQYVQPQPQYVEQQPQYVVVEQAPPAVIVEQRPPPPSGLHVWIDGSWAWSNQRYSWQAGRYEVPPQQGAVWIAPRYERDTHGYRYTPGQWKKQNGHNEQSHGNNDQNRGHT